MSAEDAARLLESLDRELWVVTASSAGERGGLLAAFVSRASIVPELPRVLVGLSKQHRTREIVEECGCFALHLVAPSQADRAWLFGTRSQRELDKFAGLAVRAGATGSPILTDAPGWLDCRVESRLDTGDGMLYLAEVVDGGSAPGGGEGALTISGFIGQGTPDQLRRLGERMAHHREVDARAIEEWRRRRKEAESGPADVGAAD